MLNKNSHTLHIFLAPQKIGHCTASDIVADGCTTLEELPTALCLIGFHILQYQNKVLSTWDGGGHAPRPP